MGNATKYWASTMFRGVAAILAGTGVFFLPHIISSELRAPIAASFAMLCLAAFAVIDAAILSRTVWTVSGTRREQLALRVQGVGGLLLGVLLFGMVYRQMDLRWFLAAAALQAMLAAGSSLAMADGVAASSKSLFCHLSAAVAIVCAISLLVGTLTARSAGSWLINGYLCFFGLNLMLLAVTMLSGDTVAPAFNLDKAALR